MSGIGEFLREIMPSWLGGSARDGSLARGGTWRRRRQVRDLSADDAHELAREADAVWQENLDEGLHAEAFPEPIPGKRLAAARKHAAASTKRPSAPVKREKPSGSNGPH